MISVIIPARNAARSLGRCLEALKGQSGLDQPYEVIVVDDGSSDPTASIAEAAGAVVIRQANAGPAAARNAGALRARGEILAFTDADCEPCQDWLAELVRPLADPGIVAVKGAYRTRQTGFVPRFVQQEYAHKYRRMARLPQIDFVDTYAAAYRRSVFLENGGFDTAFRVPSVEDQELSFRLARKGYRMVFAPQAVVYHQHDVSLAEYLRRKTGIGYWKAFMLRWLPERAFSDSHTPASQRVQIGLLALFGIALVAGIFWQPGLWLALAAIVAFGLTAVPFLAFLAREDPALLPIAPWMLLARAGSLGLGLAGGVIAPPASGREAIGPSGIDRVLKRMLDLIGGTLGLLLSLPPIGLAALAIKLESPGPAFFVQTRMGEHGRPFRMIKLRSMVQDADRHVADVLAASPLSGPVFKVPNDPRVTRVGRWLRRWSLDELPQFWNVIRGDMSLVGPRPEECWVVEQYDDRQRLRLTIKPGLTGPVQVDGRGSLGMDARLALELEYIEHYSILRDLVLLGRSIPAVFGGRGAY